MKFLNNIDLKNKKILFRADLNVPVLNGKVSDYSRIKSIVPSINQLLKNNNKVFILAHFGRPKGKINKKYSLKFLCNELASILKKEKIHFIEAFEDIVIKDTYDNNDSRIIYARTGFFSQLNDQNFLVLNLGKILNINEGKTTVINFNRTQLNLSEYSSKTTKYPKLQEVSVALLSKCLFQPKDQRSTIMLGDKNEFRFQCSHEPKQLDNLSQEFFSRIFKPLYIPLLAIVSALLLIKSKNSIGYSRYKIIIFVTGIILISFSEILTKFFTYDFNKSFLLMIIPILFSIIFYFLFYKQSLTSSK